MDNDPFDSYSAPGGGAFEATVDVRRAPEGICLVQLLNVESAISRNSGNRMWVWDFAIRSYLEPKEVGDDFNGELVKVYTALSKQAMWKLDETLRALGVPIAEGGAVKFKKEDVLGVVCKAAIKHSEYNGKPQVNIQALGAHPLGAGHREPLPDIHAPSPGFGGGEDIPF